MYLRDTAGVHVSEDHCFTPLTSVQVMQALSHYSYHCNSGGYVLCDLQGAVYRRSVVITDPVVHSRKQIYGPTDMEVDGILQFFDHHYCNEYCCPSWQQPKRTHTKFPVRWCGAGDHGWAIALICWGRHLKSR